MATALHSASGCTRFDALPGLVARLDRIAGRWQPSRRRSREHGALFARGEREPRNLGLSHSDFISVTDGSIVTIGLVPAEPVSPGTGRSYRRSPDGDGRVRAGFHLA
jgi:hypothetical protein